MDSKEMDKPVVSCENSLDQSFWETKWQSQQTAWDIGEASPAKYPLRRFFSTSRKL